MSYSIQFRQTCTICFDQENLIRTRVESTAIESQSSSSATNDKVLRCGHAFHKICINRFFYDGNSNCPNCRAPVAEEDREYDLTSDPAPPEGFDRYYSSQSSQRLTYIVPVDLPEEKKQRFLPYFLAMKPEASHETLSAIPGQAPSLPPMYVDAQGVSHATLQP